MAQDLLGISNATVNAQQSAQQQKMEELQSKLHQASSADGSKRDVDKVAKEFEALFVQEMLGHLFAGTKPDPMFGGGSAENIYRSMLIEHYSQAIADRGQLGISQNIKRTLLHLQEVTQHDPTPSPPINNSNP